MRSQSRPRLSGPGLLCTCTGLPTRRNNTAESSAGGQTEVRAQKSAPKQAARLETHGAEGKSGPDSGAEQGGWRWGSGPGGVCPVGILSCYPQHSLQRKTGAPVSRGLPRPQSLLRGASVRGRCSRHTTFSGSAALSSSRRPPRSPVCLYRRRPGCSTVMGTLKFR